MPWKIHKWPRRDGYRVVNTDTGHVLSSYPMTWAEARKQLRAVHRKEGLEMPRVRRAPPARHVRGGRAPSSFAQFSRAQQVASEPERTSEQVRREGLTEQQRSAEDAQVAAKRAADEQQVTDMRAQELAAANAARLSKNDELKAYIARKSQEEEAQRAASQGKSGFLTTLAQKAAQFTGALTSTSMPPNVKKLLDEVGGETITSLYAARAPIAKALEGALSLLAAGKWEGAKSAGGFDQVYHLRLIINGKYTLEKVERVSFTRGVGEPSETCKVPLEMPDPSGRSRWLPVTITIREFYAHAEDVMGAQKFYGYDAFQNNCQSFVSTVLRANGLQTPTVRAFIVQDAETLMKNTPEYLSHFSRALTNVGNIVNRTLQGGSRRAQLYEITT